MYVRMNVSCTYVHPPHYPTLHWRAPIPVRHNMYVGASQFVLPLSSHSISSLLHCPSPPLTPPLPFSSPSPPHSTPLQPPLSSPPHSISRSPPHSAAFSSPLPHSPALSPYPRHSIAPHVPSSIHHPLLSPSPPHHTSLPSTGAHSSQSKDPVYIPSSRVANRGCLFLSMYSLNTLTSNSLSCSLMAWKREQQHKYVHTYVRTSDIDVYGIWVTFVRQVCVWNGESNQETDNSKPKQKGWMSARVNQDICTHVRTYVYVVCLKPLCARQPQRVVVFLGMCMCVCMLILHTHVHTHNIRTHACMYVRTLQTYLLRLLGLRVAVSPEAVKYPQHHLGPQVVAVAQYNN